MKRIQFEHVTPDQLKVGDIVMCFAHDDQWERRAAQVISIELDDIPGVFTFSDSGGSYAYEYRLWLTCRHISLKRLDAEGGPAFTWHRFPWNKTARYL
jgi:hypothetical protein